MVGVAVLHDQKGLWTSPARVRARDLKWLLPVAGSVGWLLTTDERNMRERIRTNPLARDRSLAVSNVSAGSLAAVPALLYWWGWQHRDDYSQRTSVLSARAVAEVAWCRARNLLRAPADDSFESWTDSRFGHTLYGLYFLSAASVGIRPELLDDEMAELDQDECVAQAEAFLAGKKHLWNAGMFFMSARLYLSELEAHRPEEALAMTLDGRITDAIAVMGIQRVALERAGRTGWLSRGGRGDLHWLDQPGSFKNFVAVNELSVEFVWHGINLTTNLYG